MQGFSHFQVSKGKASIKKDQVYIIITKKQINGWWYTFEDDYCARKYINIKGERKRTWFGIGFYEGGEVRKFSRHEQATPMNYTTCLFAL
jgi:hypothetical protein